MINGIINVYKEKGYTSHDVVAKLRGILKQKKIGHTGTLDPDAQGVLPICLGKGTKICDMLTEKDKTYETEMLLGVVTDTQDTTGNIISKKPVQLDTDEIKEVILGFIGEYQQIPPMYSAIKVNGKKLYELAREGKEIERKARKVIIHHIKITNIDFPYVRLIVQCSKGTYIRTLCHDIGYQLGCGGCMNQLTRTQVGRFEIQEAKNLNQIEELAKTNAISSILTEIDEMFLDYPSFTVDSKFNKILLNGNPIHESMFISKQNLTELPTMIRIYDVGGKFIGIYKWNTEKKNYKPIKIFME
ncbi:tRNA pseudouridine(55) synthase TruB [Anaerosacchariphilus polymeriproducens]|uniref:tRNA pseudouridine synthase B n=1 Tax=Anaerosacchariphilus polymeriproducens TaxID=1812858 RepID=A0A371AXS9_9FIRM|nr:tRNA pseudouridine(55) synthase TruB [Anaerosacchariphilus polymeriproducens]RDU24369.1 tRNA pseudouridine(55) synthase TruB [Anaerosacchariphilus polymeriproducens]